MGSNQHLLLRIEEQNCGYCLSKMSEGSKAKRSTSLVDRILGRDSAESNWYAARDVFRPGAGGDRWRD